MKKLISIILILACVMGLAACSAEPDTVVVPEDTDTSPEILPTDIPAASPTPEVTPEPTPEETAEPTPTPTPAAPATDIESLVASMSLEEKVSQMIMASCHEAGSAQRAASFGVGALCLYADSFEGKTKAQVKEMNDSLQAASAFPLIISTDEEGGTVCRISLNSALRAVPFWASKDLYSYGGWELIESDAKEKAELFLKLGLSVDLAPVCDVPLSTSDYMYDRSFGLDASATAEYVSRTVKTFKENGIGCALKHFPGYGGSTDTHKGLAYDSRSIDEFRQSDFLPFKAGIEAGADAVLVSHNIVDCMDPNYPSSLSPEVHRVLREELGFTGVIMTDDLYMDAIKQFTNGQNPAVQAVLAGNDLLCCADFEASHAAIVAAVNDGTISISQIDSSVSRILNWKSSLGLDIFVK